VSTKRTVRLGVLLSAALVGTSAAFAVSTGVFRPARADRVGTFQTIEQQLHPASGATSTTTDVSTPPPSTPGARGGQGTDDDTNRGDTNRSDTTMPSFPPAPSAAHDDEPQAVGGEHDDEPHLTTAPTPAAASTSATGSPTPTTSAHDDDRVDDHSDDLSDDGARDDD
jgi:hypothetical protein